MAVTFTDKTDRVTIGADENVTSKFEAKNGNDYIVVNAKNVSIDGGAGVDRITLNGVDGDIGNVEITGGAGADVIYNNSTVSSNKVVYNYAKGDGNDVIYGWRDGDVINFTTGITKTDFDSSKISHDGRDWYLQAGSNKITLKDVGPNVKIQWTFGGNPDSNNKETSTGNALTGKANAQNTKLFNTAETSVDGITITGGSQADTIKNNGDYDETNSNPVIIDAKAGNDNIENKGAGKAADKVVSISAGDGNDTVTNTGGYVVIDGDAGNDVITNEGANVSISGGEGADKITTKGNDVVIDAGAGNDTITITEGKKLKITAGAGNDSIVNNITDYSTGYSNNGDGVTYTFGTSDGTNTIWGFNAAYDKLVFIGETSVGSDTGGPNVTLTAGGTKVVLASAPVGTDVKVKYNIKKTEDAEDVTTGEIVMPTFVSGTAVADTIVNSQSYDIKTYAGNDVIRNHASVSGDALVIDAGAGNDVIYNGDAENYDESEFNGAQANNVSIFGGDGNDTIYNYADNATLGGGTGNDLIVKYNGGTAVFQYTGGKDTIRGFEDGDILQFMTDTAVVSDSTAAKVVFSDSFVFSSVRSGNDIIVTVGAGTTNVVTLKDVEIGSGVILADKNGVKITEKIEMVPVVTLTGSQEIEPEALGSSIVGGSSADTLANYSDGVSINAQGGNDVIENWAKEDVLIDGGAGADTIINVYQDDESAEATDITANVTVDGGAGNDYIENFQSHAIVNGGAENDTIINYAKSDAKLEGGAGTDFIETWTAASIYGGAGNDTINLETNSSTDGKGNTIVINKGDGTDLILGATQYDSLVLGSDYIDTGESSAAVKTGVEVIRKGKDLVVQSGTTVLATVQGYGREGIKLYAEKEKALQATAAVSITNYTDTVTLSSGADYFTNNDAALDDSYTINAGAGNDTIENKAASVVINGEAGDDYIVNDVAYELADYYKDADHGLTGDTKTTDLTAGQTSTLNGGAGNDTIVNYGSGVKSGDNFVSRVTTAGDDFGKRKTDTTNSDSDTNVVIIGDAGNDYIENYGYRVSISGGAGNDTIVTEAVELGDDGIVTIDGGAGNDLIISSINAKSEEALKDDKNSNITEDKHKVIYQIASVSAGADTIRGFLETDELYLTSGTSIRSVTEVGNGNVLVSLSSGSVLLEDYAGKKINYVTLKTDGEGEDAVTTKEEHTTIASANVSLSARNDTRGVDTSYQNVSALAGNDNINVTAAYVTVDGGLGRDVINVAIGNTYKADSVYVYDDDDEDAPEGHVNIAASISGGAGNDTINANAKDSEANKDIIIDGGIGHDYINLASIDTGTVIGGKGNDTIKVATEADNADLDGKKVVIQYAKGDGRDVIYGLDADNAEKYVIQFTDADDKADFTANKKGNDTVVKYGGGSITLKNFTDTIVFEASDASVLKASLGDILDDDLFMSFEARISDISEISADNYSAGKFEPTDYTSLGQSENPYLTYSQDDKDK